MRGPIDTDVAVETPEHIVFHYRLAGPARRAIAHVLDLAICYGAVALVALLVVLATIPLGSTRSAGGELSGLAKAGGGLVLLVLFAAQWLYFMAWEGTIGRSPGKAALGVRVVTTTGRPVGMREAALRNLLRAADLLPTAYAAGLVSMALTRRFQRLGDLVAGTMVVVPAAVRAAHPVALAPPAAPREVATLPDEVTLDVDERAAIELFLRRRDSLGASRQYELASMIAGPIGERLGFQHPDPSRLLALVYDRAVNVGRTDAPPSSWRPRTKTKQKKTDVPA